MASPSRVKQNQTSPRPTRDAQRKQAQDAGRSPRIPVRESPAWNGSGKYLLLIAFLALLSGVLYFNSFHVPFQFDDRPNIVDNDAVRLRSISADRLLRILTSSFSGSIRFFSYFTFALNFYVGELNVFGYHLVNVLIHLVSGMLLFWLILLTLNLPSQKDKYGGIAFKVAAVTSILFIVHPVQTQAVTYIVQRMTSLAALLYILAMIFFIKGRLATGKKRSFYYGAMAVSGVFSIFSKENAFFLPISVLIYEFLFFQPGNAKLFFQKRWKLLAVLAGLAVLGFLLLGGKYLDVLREGYRYRDFTMAERVLTQFRVVIHYLTLLVYPHPSRLNLDYDFPVSRSLFEPSSTFLCAATIIVIFAIGIWRMRTWPVLSFCIFWFLGNLLIESSVIPLEMVYEHRLYLPSIGPLFLFSLLFVRVWDAAIGSERRKRAVSLCALLALVIPLSWATIVRNSMWGSESELWKDVIKKSPNKGRPHYNLGYFYFTNGEVVKAKQEFELASRLDPKLAPAYLNLGVIHYNAGDKTTAIQLFRQALALDPKYAQASLYLKKAQTDDMHPTEDIAKLDRTLQGDPKNVSALHDKGLMYVKSGEWERALSQFSEVLKINPDHAAARVNIAEIYLRKGLPDKALTEVQKAINLNPEGADAYALLGLICLHQRKLDEGISAFQQAIRINPNDIPSQMNLGLAYRYKGRTEEAILQFQKVLSLRSDDEEARLHLADAYLSQHKLNEAIQEGQRVLAINPGSVSARMHLGKAYFEQNRLDQAIREWKKVIEIEPKRAKAHHSLAVAYYAKKEFRLAVQHLDKASALGFKVNPQLAEWLKSYR